jgi:tetratricopeptide (TPR) repeat protein
MSKARLLVIMLSVLFGTAIMAVLIVPLNLALLRVLTGGQLNHARPRVAVDPLALPPPIARPFGVRRLEAGKEGNDAIQALLDDLGDAIRAGDAQRVGEHFHMPRLVKEFRKAGVLQGLAEQAEPQFAAVVVKRGVTEALIGDGLLPGWGRTEIRSVRLLADGNEAVVIARHRDANINKMRWWLIREDGVWRVYDFEDVDITGIRLSSMLGSLRPVRAGLPEVPQAWARASVTIQDAAAAVRRGDYAGARRTLQGMDMAALHARLEAVRWQLLGAATVGLRDFYNALPCLDRARALNFDMPYLDMLYAAAYNHSGKPHEALKHLQKYRTLLGDDCDTFYQLGMAHARLGQASEAVTAFRKCLDDDPNLVACLYELRRVLPRGKKGELADRFARLVQPEAQFEQLVLRALADLDTEAALAFISAMRGRTPNDPVVDACEARARALAGQVEPALTLFKKAMANLQDEQKRKAYLREFLFDLADTGEALRGYHAAPDRREAFPLLAQQLLARRDADELRSLIAAHRRADKDDPWAYFYTGELHADAKEYDQADRAFAAAQSKVTEEARREQIRSRRVSVRCQAGKGLSAYDDIGPRAATFTQLARWFAQGRDGKRLVALVAAHRRDEPGDRNLPLWEAEAAWLAQDHAETVRLLQKYRDGVFADPANRFNFVHRLLRSLAKLGRLDEFRKEAEALVRGGPADRAPLRFALASLVHDRQTEAVAALASALRAAAPGDPEGQVWQARVEILKGGLAKAGTLLRSALGRQQQPPERARYLREFLYDSAAAGKPLDGYREAPDPDSAFRTLADALLGRFSDRSLPVADFDDDFPDDDFDDEPLPPRRMSAAQASAALRQLIAAHLEKRPDDAAAHLYAGEIYRREGAYDKAAEAFAHGMARKPPPELRLRFQYDHVQALYQAGKGLSAYTDLGRDKQTYYQLASLFVRDHKAKGLEALIAAHRQTEPNDPTLPVWETEARFVAGDYAAALQLLRQHRDGAFAQPNERWRYKDRLVRSLVRLKRFDEALHEARAFAKERNGNLLLPAVVYAAAGDVAKTEAELVKCARRYYGTYAFYNDPDLGPALGRAPFRALRQRFPEYLPLPLSERGRRGPRF